jgi:hypothetical protein
MQPAEAQSPILMANLAKFPMVAGYCCLSHHRVAGCGGCGIGLTAKRRCFGNPPESKGLHKWNFLGRIHERILNEDKQIH